MMNKIFSRALFGALFGACLTTNASATPGDLNVGSSGNSAIVSPATNGLTLSFAQATPQALNTSSGAQLISLTTTGADPITIHAIGEDSPNFTVSNNGCNPGAQVSSVNPCTFEVKFTPVFPGIRYAELVVRSNAQNSATGPIIHLVGNAALTISQTVNISGVPGSSFAYGTTTSFPVTASAATSPVSISGSGACSGSGSGTATINVTGAGTCTVTATAPASPIYSSATNTATVSVSQASQTISVSAPATFSFAASQPITGISASATSGLTVVYGTTTPTICTVSGQAVTMQSTGTCHLTFDQAGNGNYSAAAQKTADIVLATLQTQRVTFQPSSPVTYSTNGTFNLSASSDSGLQTFNFASSSLSICTVVGSTVTMVNAGNCALTATQPGNGTFASASANATVVINKGNQVITFAPASPQNFVLNGTFALSASSSASLTDFSYATSTPAVCSVSGATATMLATGTCSLSVSEPGNNNFNAGSATANVVIQLPTTDLCLQQNLQNTELALDWGGGNIKSFALQANQSYSFQLGETPANAWGGQISTVYGGVQKVISISTEKCDFSQELESKRCLIGGNDPSINYTNNSRNTFACVLTPGRTYFVNVRNAMLNGNYPIRPLVDSCTGICQFYVQY